MSKNKKRVKKQQQPVKSPSKQGVVASKTEIYSGPIPSSIELEQYGRIDSTLPHRIIKMAEKQHEHQSNQEKAHLAMYSTYLLRGQWMGFALSFVLITIGGCLVYLERAVFGIVWGTPGILLVLLKVIMIIVDLLKGSKQSSKK